MQIGGVFVALVEWQRSQSHESESLLSIVANDLDASVVYANPFVRVSDGHVEGEVVFESVVGAVEIELG